MENEVIQEAAVDVAVQAQLVLEKSSLNVHEYKYNHQTFMIG